MIKKIDYKILSILALIFACVFFIISIFIGGVPFSYASTFALISGCEFGCSIGLGALHEQQEKGGKK